MPDFQNIAPASRDTVREAKVGIVDINGNTSNVILGDIPSGVSDAQINSWRSAIGAVTNGGVYQDVKSVIQRQLPRDSRAFLEPYSTVSSVGVLVFKHSNPLVEDKYIEIPSISNSLVTDNGALDNDDAEIQAVINATLPILNNGNPFDGAYAFFKSYYSDRKGSRKRREGNVPTTIDPRGTPDPTP